MGIYMILSFAQLILISTTMAKPHEDSKDHDNSLTKRWAPTETHVGQLILTLQQKILEDHLKNQNNGKNTRSIEESDILQEAIKEALQNDDLPGYDGIYADKRNTNQVREELLYPVNIGPVQDMSRLILNALKEIHDQQLRDGYIGRPNPVRMVG